MEIKKYVALVSLIITMIILFSLLLLGSFFDKKREEYVSEQFHKMNDDFNDIQILFLMSDIYGDEMICLALENKITDLDMNVWVMGEKLDKYRAATEEFQKSEYYKDQKKIFNENEASYFLLLKRMIEKCNISKQILLFFYRNSEDCKKCDDQSFILSDINEIDDKKGGQEIAIFSFDMDLNLSTINILSEYYKTKNLPCIMLNDETYCGIQDKNFIMQKICEKNKEFLIC